MGTDRGAYYYLLNYLKIFKPFIILFPLWPGWSAYWYYEEEEKKLEFQLLG